MADSLSISPVALSGPAGISPVASTLPGTARFAINSSLFADERSEVDLSTEGQLLSALSTFRTSLPTLSEFAPVVTSDDQAIATLSTNAEETPLPTALPAPDDAILAAAQGLVDAFNSLLDNISTLPSGTAAPSADDIAEQLTATVSALATPPIAADDGASLNLSSIGIAPSATGPALQLDQTQLATAIANAPAATQAVLADTTEAFAAFAATAERQLVSAATPPLPTADLNLLGTETPLPAAASGLPSLTQTPANLPGTTPTPTLVPTLGSAALNSEIVLPIDETIRAALQVTGLAITSGTANSATGTPGDEPGAASTTPAPAQPTSIATSNAPTAGITPLPAAPPASATLAPAATSDALAAEQRSTTANQILQTLLADPRLRAINNQFDPAYAAVIAASHLSDFDSPRSFIDPSALSSNSVGPVSALVRAQAIADYREAAGEAEQRTLIGTSTTHQYWV